jgi:hypothetical protein
MHCRMRIISSTSQPRPSDGARMNRASGVMLSGVEKANVKVTLASQIPPEDCARLNLGYLDPTSIDPAEWQNREDEGILYVAKTGEMLYKVK